jgi:ABC-type transport system involved in multi-copper enzyme maturation permease subunit
MKDLLGSALGAACGIGVLTLWVLVPISLSVLIFRRKDL